MTTMTTSTDVSNAIKVVLIYTDGTHRAIDVVIPALKPWSTAMKDVGHFAASHELKPVSSVVYIEGTMTQIYSAGDAAEIFGL